MQAFSSAARHPPVAQVQQVVQLGGVPAANSVTGAPNRHPTAWASGNTPLRPAPAAAWLHRRRAKRAGWLRPPRSASSRAPSAGGGARLDGGGNQEGVALVEGFQPVPVDAQAARVPAAAVCGSEGRGGGRNPARQRGGAAGAAATTCRGAPAAFQSTGAERPPAAASLATTRLSAARKATTGWSFFSPASPYTMISRSHQQSCTHFKSSRWL